jgi:hypothetical protein
MEDEESIRIGHLYLFPPSHPAARVSSVSIQ